MPFHLRRKRQPIGRGLGHLAPSRAALPFIALAVAMAALACSSSSTSDIRQSSASTVSDAVTYGDLPLAFEENRGQSADGVRFISRGNGFTAFMTPDGITLALRLRAPDGSGSLSDESVDYTTMGMRLVGANASPDVGGLRELGGKTNYFVSTEPAGWHLGVPSYSKVRYSEVYPGIDLVFFGNQRSLEYNFVLSPGSDPNLIGLSFQGADSVSLDEDGNLALAIGGGTVLHQAPVTYQVSDGGIREIVDSRYTLRAVAGDEAGAGDYQIGFELGAYDHSRGLVIDPEISYSSYLGGNKLDWSSDIALDSEGYAYIVGYTTSPRTFDVGGLSGELAGDVDIFVAKFSKDGGELVYATYLGGSEDDKGLAIAVDEGGAAFITGLTESEDYPVTVGAFRDRFPKGQTSSFITKLNPSGDALDYSTYVGGRSGNGIAIDSEGNAYITGHATASDFPTTIGSFQPDYVHGFEAFIAKLNAEGSALAYATYLGGEGADYGTAIAVDIDGDAYVTGRTNSDDFPTTAGAYSATNQGGVDVFVARLNQAGSELVYSTLLGGEEDDLGTDIALDSALNAYVTGETGSGDFPSENSLNDDFTDGAVDAFVTSIDPTGGSLVFSINVGAESVDIGNSIAVDRHGDIWVAGETDSSNMETEKPVQDDREGESDAFVVKLEAGGVRLLFSTFLGGSDNDIATGVAVDSSGSAYVTGVSYSTDFPIGDSVQEEPGGVGDAFVTKVSFLAELTLDERPVIRNESGGFTQDLTYTLVVTNEGPDMATNVVLIDHLPEGAVLISASPTKGRWTDAPKGSCAEDSGTVTCSLGKLGAGTSAKVTIKVAPTISGPQVNIARVEGGQTDSYVGDNAVDAQTDVVAPPPTATPTPTPTATPTPEPVATSTDAVATPAPAISTSTPAEPTPTPEPNGSNDMATSSDEAAAELVSFSPQAPDLIVSIAAPAAALPGENISSQVVITVENVGSAIAEGYQVDTVLSTDRFVLDDFPEFSGRTFEEDALLSGGRTVSKKGVEPGESVSVASIILRIPRDTPVGAYYLCAIADSADTTLEEDESNNVSCAELFIGNESSPEATEDSPSEPVAESSEPAEEVDDAQAGSSGGCSLPSAGRTPVDLGWVLVGLIGPGLLLRRRMTLPWAGWTLRIPGRNDG